MVNNVLNKKLIIHERNDTPPPALKFTSKNPNFFRVLLFFSSQMKYIRLLTSKI